MTAEELGVLRPEIFDRDIEAVQRQFGELEKSLRMEHMTEGGQAERLKAEREAERRRKDEAIRRARKKEQEARDPKKKVALRLENKREFEKDTASNDARLPLTKVDFGGGYKGHEEVALVDVLKLRQKCIFMEQGVKVRHMVESMARREKLERAAKFVTTSPGESTATPPRFSTMSAASGATASEIFEMKLKRMKEVSDLKRAENMIQKIGAMRSTLAYQLPYRFEASPDEGEGALKISRDILGNGAAVKLREKKAALALVAHFGEHIESDDLSSPSSTTAPAPPPQQGGRRRRSIQAMKAEVGGAPSTEIAMAFDSNVKREKKPKREKVEQPDTAAKEASKRAQKRWMFARSFVQWFLIYRAAKKRKSADIVQVMLLQLGEWARVKRAVTDYMRKVKAVQRVGKSFAKIKKQRCTSIEKDWQRVEDHNLQAYFNLTGILDKAKKKANADAGDDPRSGSMGAAAKKRAGKLQLKVVATDAKQQHLINMMEAGGGTSEVSLDWRSYRIPVAERKRAVSRFYFAQLRKQVLSQASFIDTVREAVSAERDLVSFLKLFGAAEDSIKDTADKMNDVAPETVASAPFWQLSEETLMQLIAVSAQALVGTDPFKHHPANLDLPESGSRLAARSRIAQSRGEAPVALGRWMRKPERRSAIVDQGEGEKRRAASDRANVMDRFTPRLREYSEDNGGEPHAGGEGSESKDILMLGMANATHLPSAERGSI